MGENRRCSPTIQAAPGGVEPPLAASKAAALSAELRGRRARVADGTRTRDHRDHNPGLYQLSYRHRARTSYRRGRTGLRSVRTDRETAAVKPVAGAMRPGGFEPPTIGLEGRRSSSELRALGTSRLGSLSLPFPRVPLVSSGSGFGLEAPALEGAAGALVR